jgi:cytochrome c-type biogenesis protein CcmH
MNGWVILGLLAVSSFGALMLFGRLQKGLWQVAAAVILLGMTGYALTGRPGTPASPAKSLSVQEGTALQLIETRAEMDQIFSAAKRWLVTADSFAKQGDYHLSAAYIQAGLRQNPENPDLWSALGLQLMLASQGQMSRPAQLAFDKARAIQPNYPAPYYFAGLSRLFGGDVNGAILLWEKALSMASPKAKWRPRLESQLNAAKALRDGIAKPSENKPSSN